MYISVYIPIYLYYFLPCNFFLSCYNFTLYYFLPFAVLGVYGQGCEDVLTHLLNFIWPNIFEVSPHVINAMVEAIEGLTVALGPGRVLQYVLQGKLLILSFALLSTKLLFLKPLFVK